MSPALLELDEAEEQLSPMYIAPQPRATDLWPVCTENQWLSRAIGWEKIAKTSTDGFPDHKATIRVNSNTGKSDMVYTVYFNRTTATHKNSWGSYTTRGRMYISAFGEPGARRFDFNGHCATGGDLQKVNDTIEMIESKIQAATTK